MVAGKSKVNLANLPAGKNTPTSLTLIILREVPPVSFYFTLISLFKLLKRAASDIPPLAGGESEVERG